MTEAKLSPYHYLFVPLLLTAFFHLMLIFGTTPHVFSFTYRQSHPQVIQLPASRLPSAKDQLEIDIRRMFGSDGEVALAVFKAESGLNPRNMNWNCYYGGVSRSCDKTDRAQAWSVDCGIAQINVLGQDCPEELFDPKVNLQRAFEKYQRRGWQPWVAYWSGSYRRYL